MQTSSRGPTKDTRIGENKAASQITSPFPVALLQQVTSLNLDPKAGGGTAAKLLKLVKEQVSPAYLNEICRSAEIFTEIEALEHLGTLGFFTSSLEYHFRQAYGQDCDSVVFATLPGLEIALTELGYRIGRNPRDDCYTAWICNPPYTWTGSNGERRFGAAVRGVDAALNDAAQELLSLRTGKVTLADASPGMARASERVREAREIMKDLVVNPFPEEFQAMRNFLIPMTINGRIFEAPNATYAAGWNRTDVAIGNHDERLKAHITERIRHMATSDMATMMEERRLPSIADIVANATGVTICSMSADRLETAALGLESSIAEAVQQAIGLAKEMAILAGVHMGAIKKNLPDDDQEVGVTHDAEMGVSGRPVAITAELNEMRRQHPLTRAKVT